MIPRGARARKGSDRLRYVGHAFVDWDDTIAENIRYFNETEAANARLIAGWTGADTAHIRQRGQELDLQVARQMGLVRESLETAWLACYQEFAAGAGVALRAEAEAAIRESCRRPYEVQQELLPGAAESLAWLVQNGFEVTIWTAGDDAVQRRKIRDSGLDGLIHRARIVVDKTPERLRAAMEDREPSRCFVAGNSVHSDIRSALAVGILALHAPAETWAYDHGRVDATDPNYRVIAGIADLPSAVSRLYDQRLRGIESAG